jgi:type IV pilus assembly protein PilC
MFERIYTKVSDAIREGETIAKPMKENSYLGFHPMALFYWVWMGMFPGIMMLSVALTAGRGAGKSSDGGPSKNAGGAKQLLSMSLGALAIGAFVCAAMYLLKTRSRVIDDLVVNMIDVGEETGELDTMLYKIADNYDEEVRVMTEGLTKLIEPLLIVFLGVAVGFIVVSLFMPLISLITNLSGQK